MYTCGDSDNSNADSLTGVITGGIFGGIVLIIIIVLIVLYMRKSNKTSSDDQYQQGLIPSDQALWSIKCVFCIIIDEISTTSDLVLSFRVCNQTFNGLVIVTHYFK